MEPTQALRQCQMALAEVAGVFDYYAAEHDKKETPEGHEKAQRNRVIAAAIRGVVVVTGGDVARSGPSILTADIRAILTNG